MIRRVCVSIMSASCAVALVGLGAPTASAVSGASDCPSQVHFTTKGDGAVHEATFMEVDGQLASKEVGAPVRGDALQVMQQYHSPRTLRVFMTLHDVAYELTGNNFFMPYCVFSGDIPHVHLFKGHVEAKAAKADYKAARIGTPEATTYPYPGGRVDFSVRRVATKSQHKTRTVVSVPDNAVDVFTTASGQRLQGRIPCASGHKVTVYADGRVDS